MIHTKDHVQTFISISAMKRELFYSVCVDRFLAQLSFQKLYIRLTCALVSRKTTCSYHAGRHNKIHQYESTVSANSFLLRILHARHILSHDPIQYSLLSDVRQCNTCLGSRKHISECDPQSRIFPLRTFVPQFLRLLLKKWPKYHLSWTETDLRHLSIHIEPTSKNSWF